MLNAITANRIYILFLAIGGLLFEYLSNRNQGLHNFLLIQLEDNCFIHSCCESKKLDNWVKLAPSLVARRSAVAVCSAR